MPENDSTWAKVLQYVMPLIMALVIGLIALICFVIKQNFCLNDELQEVKLSVRLQDATMQNLAQKIDAITYTTLRERGD